MENIGQIIKQISNKLINDLNLRLKKYDPTVSQLQVLLILQENKKPIYQKEIAAKLKVKHTSLIDILKVLERKNFIYRKPSIENAKCTEVTLTNDASSILKELDYGKDKTEEMITRTLGFSSTEKMLSTFHQVLKNLEEK